MLGLGSLFGVGKDKVKCSLMVVSYRREVIKLKLNDDEDGDDSTCQWIRHPYILLSFSSGNFYQPLIYTSTHVYAKNIVAKNE